MRSSSSFVLLLAAVVALACAVTLVAAAAQPAATAQPVATAPAAAALPHSALRRHHSHHRSSATPSQTAASSHTAAAASAPNYYKSSHWCGSGQTYLSDLQCAKVFPSSFNRSWSSPVRVSQIPDPAQGWAQDTGRFSDVKVDTTRLQEYLSDGPNIANVCVILIKRPVQGGVYFKYFCGAGDDTNAFQPWSSTKIYAQANAGGHIREFCPSAGLVSDTTGAHGSTPLGDLSTIITSYDETQGYTSNGLSKYFHDLGNRYRLLSLVDQWFGPLSVNLSLGGNYGVATPSDLGTTLQPGNCKIINDTNHIALNQLTALAHVDILRRLVLNEDLPVVSRFPDLSAADRQTIMYGAEQSALFPGLQWGGMSTSIDIYVQSALDMSEVEFRSSGQWRIFSKMGAGWNGPPPNSNTGDVLTATYATFPVIDQKTGEAVVDQGVEFLIVGRSAVIGDSGLVVADAVLQQAVASITKAIYEGLLK